MSDATFDMLQDDLDDEEGFPKKFYGVVTGWVLNLLDPQGLGRVQVRLPFIDDLDLSPWARIAVPSAGLLCGTYFAPKIQDEVLVAFEHGDTNSPYIIGFLWNSISRPPVFSPIAPPFVQTIRTLTGSQIVFTETPPSITIQTPTPPFPAPAPFPPSPTGPHHTIRMSAESGVQIMSPLITQQSGGSSILMSPGSIILQSGGSSIAITPDGITIIAPNVSVIGSANVTIFGGTVNIN